MKLATAAVGVALVPVEGRLKKRGTGRGGGSMTKDSRERDDTTELR
jgi:hypothetical protein